MLTRIDRFQGEFRFLSNFWPAVVLLDDVWYQTVEHAYQAAKTFDPEARTRIKDAPGPAEAKKLGKQVSLRPDWEHVKFAYMRWLIWYKFSHHVDLGQKLIATGDAELIEGNTWGDTVWGVCRGVGENWLGRILMETRALLNFYWSQT